MYGPVSTAVGACCLGYAALNVYALPGSAISQESVRVNQAASALLRSAEASQVLFGAKGAALSQLESLAFDCGSSDWDGNGASAVNSVALRNAESLIRALPEDVPMPEFAAEPDGSISFDWIQSSHCLFSLSVGPSNRLAYAWLDGSDKGHGVARFDGFSVPPRILADIHFITSRKNAVVRAS